MKCPWRKESIFENKFHSPFVDKLVVDFCEEDFIHCKEEKCEFFDTRNGEPYCRVNEIRESGYLNHEEK